MAASAARKMRFLMYLVEWNYIREHFAILFFFLLSSSTFQCRWTCLALDRPKRFQYNTDALPLALRVPRVNITRIPFNGHIAHAPHRWWRTHFITFQSHYLYASAHDDGGPLRKSGRARMSFQLSLSPLFFSYWALLDVTPPSGIHLYIYRLCFLICNIYRLTCLSPVVSRHDNWKEFLW